MVQKKETQKKAVKPEMQKSVDVQSQKVSEKQKITFFPASTTREDKISLFSFCLGMIVMACFFVIDLQVRNHIEMERMNNQLRLISHQMRANRVVELSHVRRAKRVQNRCSRTAKCPPVWQRQAQFNPDQYAPYDVKGTLKISGNACAALPKGVACPEKIDVFVNPKTDYSDEWWTKHWAGVNGISKTDERALKYNKRGVVQKDGSFVIEALPAGTYYVGAAMCVSDAPKRPCHPVRLGAEIKVNKDASVSLKQVFPPQK